MIGQAFSRSARPGMGEECMHRCLRMGAMAIDVAERNAAADAVNRLAPRDVLESIRVLGLNPAQSASALGISEADLHGMAGGSRASDEVDVSSRAWMLVSIAVALEELVASPVEWMGASNFLLPPAPLQHIGTAEGLGRIRDVIRAQRGLHG